MKTPYIFLAFVAVLMYNGVMRKVDRNIVESYNKICATLPRSTPDCRYAK